MGFEGGYGRWMKMDENGRMTVERLVDEWLSGHRKKKDDHI